MYMWSTTIFISKFLSMPELLILNRMQVTRPSLAGDSFLLQQWCWYSVFCEVYLYSVMLCIKGNFSQAALQWSICRIESSSIKQGNRAKVMLDTVFPFIEQHLPRQTHIFPLAEEKNTERRSGDSGRESEAKTGKTDLKKRGSAHCFCLCCGISRKLLSSLICSGGDWSHMREMNGEYSNPGRTLQFSWKGKWKSGFTPHVTSRRG